MSAQKALNGASIHVEDQVVEGDLLEPGAVVLGARNVTPGAKSDAGGVTVEDIIEAAQALQDDYIRDSLRYHEYGHPASATLRWR